MDKKYFYCFAWFECGTRLAFHSHPLCVKCSVNLVQLKAASHTGVCATSFDLSLHRRTEGIFVTATLLIMKLLCGPALYRLHLTKELFYCSLYDSGNDFLFTQWGMLSRRSSFIDSLSVKATIIPQRESSTVDIMCCFPLSLHNTVTWEKDCL